MNDDFQGLNLGWISYLNLYPLFYELRQSLPGSFRLREGSPAEVNQLLREGKVDLAPSSSICLLKDEPQESIPIGVLSKGAVESVYLGFKSEHLPFREMLLEKAKKLKANCDFGKAPESVAKKILAFSEGEKFSFSSPSLKVTKESQTSVELAAQILTALLGKKNFQAMENSDSTSEEVELLIGDQALRRRKEFAAVIDLGELWQSLVGVPFVYAVWQGNKKLSSHLKDRLIRLAAYTESKMHEDPSFYEKKFLEEKRKLPFSISLGKYWSSLYYTVDDEGKRGLDLFLALAKERSSSLAT